MNGVAESLAHLLMRPTHALSSCSGQSPCVPLPSSNGLLLDLLRLMSDTSHMAKQSLQGQQQTRVVQVPWPYSRTLFVYIVPSPIKVYHKPYTTSCPITGTLNIIRSTKLCGPSDKDCLHHPGLPVESLCFGPLAFHVTWSQVWFTEQYSHNWTLESTLIYGHFRSLV